jgi:hypothetical protein
VYGVTDNTEFGCGIAGLCSDFGAGADYSTADALQMNIYFDLSTVSFTVDAARLDFWFGDLDLIGINDPNEFFESMKVSYWDGDGDGSTLTQVGPIIDHPLDMADPSFTDGIVDYSSFNGDPITWNLDLAALGLLSALNSSNGFWLELGFGSDYFTSASNTPEFLSVGLTVSPVPLPSAVWLFGSALLGFIGMSRRTRV